jgi:integrase
VGGRHELFAEDKLKTKSSFRTLPLIPVTRTLLLEQQKKQAGFRAMFRRSYCGDFSDYVCVDEMGKLFRPNYVTDHFKLLLKNNSLREIRFHDLRHSCASLLLSQGIPMKQIQDWLGHGEHKNAQLKNGWTLAAVST